MTSSSGKPMIASLCPRKVAVLRALKLGDLLVAIPALRALRASLPAARIVLIGLPWAREFVARFPHYLDDFIEFPGWPGLPERQPDMEHIPAFLAQVQAEQFDLVIQLHGSGSHVNALCALFSARRTAGFHLPDDFVPDPPLFFPWPQRGLELERLLSLVVELGCPARGVQLEFPLGDSDHASADAICPLEPGGFVCLHAGASVDDRCWPVERFAAVADRLAACGFSIVLTGTLGENSRACQLNRALAAPGLNLAGKTTLGTLAAIISRARLLICNDTGVSHLADAVRTPSVVISTGDNPARWSPTDASLHRVLCREGWVEPNEVLGQVCDLLLLPRPVTFRGGAPCSHSVC